MEEKTFFINAEIPKTIAAEGIDRKVLAHQNHMMCVEVYFQAGAVGAEHHHPHEQISYIINGLFEFHVQGEQSIVRPGDSIYIPSDAPHGTKCLEEGMLLDVFSPHREDFIES